MEACPAYSIVYGRPICIIDNIDVYCCIAEIFFYKEGLIRKVVTYSVDVIRFYERLKKQLNKLKILDSDILILFSLIL